MTARCRGRKLHLENPGAGAEASHESWMLQKINDDWVQGPVKDAEAKTHPCMVPFGQLPAQQQAKDHIFRAVVRQLRDVGDMGALEEATALADIWLTNAHALLMEAQAADIPLARAAAEKP